MKEERTPPQAFEMDCDHPVFSSLRLRLALEALLTLEGLALPGLVVNKLVNKATFSHCDERWIRGSMLIRRGKLTRPLCGAPSASQPSGPLVCQARWV